MCGLAGFWSGKPGEDEELSRTVAAMSDTLAHRGPDDSGVWVDPAVGLAFGFRRLAVLELSPLGHQPMTSESGRYVVIFNGEIYNFQDLRSELAGRGHRFQGRSDTEVILASVEEWGVEVAVSRFNGMFAIALWDCADRTLTLARDPLGIKPLYYGRTGDTLLFASELKAFRAHTAFHPEVDPGAMALYFRHGFIPGPWSIYRGVRKLEPGCMVTFRQPTDSAVPRAYWSLTRAVRKGINDPFYGSEVEACRELELLLRDAVRRQMVADVPLGVFLSGGIDSSILVALMRDQSSVPVRTFTASFREKRFDEAPHAAKVADNFGTDHTELSVTPDAALGVIPLLPAMYDEPFADVSQIPVHLLSSLVRKHVTVCLSGEGGDELFGGYTHYWDSPAMRRRTEIVPFPFRFLAGVTARSTGRVLKEFPGCLPRRVGGSLTAHSDFLLAGSEFDLVSMHNSYWPSGDRGIVKASPYPHRLAGFFPHELDYTGQLMFYDTAVGLPDGLLTKVDRAGSFASLEVRVPLLDPGVVEFAWRLPARFKLRPPGHGKWILRSLLRRYFPGEIADRPKQGFSVPIAAWLRGALRDWAESLLAPGRLKDSGLRAGPVREAWNELLCSDCEWEPRIWIVIVYQAWRERWGRDQCRVP